MFCISRMLLKFISATRSHYEVDMQDLILIAVTVAFFGLSIAYVQLCDRLK